ncbi:MAG: hypothetical protein NTV51_20000, partial [Verrucomicrobia bacterium]|nr:hypothetical protein [Verrucomicrobiota bacterium]
MLLHHPLEGIGGNWDEWFNSEATAAERGEIAIVGGSEDFQRRFLEWLEAVWLQDAVRNDNRLALAYVVEELARVAPFDRWAAVVARGQASAGGAISAVVLAEGSDGGADDVRPVGAMLLPLEP